MLSLVAASLLVMAKVPAPKFGYERAPSEMPLFQFEVQVFELMKRAQTDPNYALVDLDNYGARATFYFKGDAKAHLARYTSDPRISAVSVPLSATELAAVSEPFIRWVRSRGFEWDWADADPKRGLVSIGTPQPYLVRAMAEQDGIDLTHIRILDTRPGLMVPERG